MEGAFNMTILSMSHDQNFFFVMLGKNYGTNGPSIGVIITKDLSYITTMTVHFQSLKDAWFCQVKCLDQ